ncbi:protocatechuate dioxygenase [Spirilliplanes yamanashiensis]|uniref:Protocatechuate dioxygenase n=1 Tax=Spirilliplanes yamanashiensis TaxID=42233 RepID=A0A8J3Y582_9ACTN|nr:protocatechuate dioxygenase [Spirilliplanes yamanashiensis]
MSRRQLIAGFGAAGVGGVLSGVLGGVLAGCSGGGAPAGTAPPSVAPPATTAPGDDDDLSSLFAGSSVCALTTATPAGPYYYDAGRIRSDVREDRAGVRLRLVLKVQDSESCGPLPGAVVEIWHCDAAGLYSGAEAVPPAGAAASAPPSGAPAATASLRPVGPRRYLRGAQVTDPRGIVEFVTVWPGRQRGRTPHVNVMVHAADAPVLTTQLMFPERLNDAVFARAPYPPRAGAETTNATDPVYDDSMLLKVTREYDGYLGVLILSADADRDGR